MTQGTRGETKLPSLTVESVRARAIVLKLKRPVVARIATLTDWPLVLIDLYTQEGIVGRSYLEPYTVRTMKYLIPALHDFGEMLQGQRVAPVDLYGATRKSLHFVGYQGMSMIAVSGLDMAAGMRSRRRPACRSVCFWEGPSARYPPTTATACG